MWFSKTWYIKQKHNIKILQETQGPQFAHLSEKAIVDNNIFPILSK